VNENLKPKNAGRKLGAKKLSKNKLSDQSNSSRHSRRNSNAKPTHTTEETKTQNLASGLNPPDFDGTKTKSKKPVTPCLKNSNAVLAEEQVQIQMQINNNNLLGGPISGVHDTQNL
jgi:hypothetical protein